MRGQWSRVGQGLESRVNRSSQGWGREYGLGVRTLGLNLSNTGPLPDLATWKERAVVTP